MEEKRHKIRNTNRAYIRYEAQAYALLAIEILALKYPFKIYVDPIRYREFVLYRTYGGRLIRPFNKVHERFFIIRKMKETSFEELDDAISRKVYELYKYFQKEYKRTHYENTYYTTARKKRIKERKKKQLKHGIGILLSSSKRK